MATDNPAAAQALTAPSQNGANPDKLPGPQPQPRPLKGAWMGLVASVGQSVVCPEASQRDVAWP